MPTVRRCFEFLSLVPRGFLLVSNQLERHRVDAWHIEIA
jgi:hypothetical protein